jgi:serine/threonine-protein kinase RsbW
MSDADRGKIEFSVQLDLNFPLDLRIPSDLRYIEGIVECVTRCCTREALSPRVCALNVPVALSEALANAILYGNRQDARKSVQVRAHLDDRELVLEVIDEGMGFDLLSSIHDPAVADNVSREDGRGLFLMCQLMDRVEQYFDGRNVVRLRLSRS